MFQNNFPNNFSNMNFNQMNNPMFPMNENNPMQMNFMMNAQMFNQMNQNQENNNFTSDDKALVNFEDNEPGFKTFNSWLNSLTDPKKKLYISNTEQKKEILVPIYFTKNDLYTYLGYYEDIIILYNNNILSNDETSIDDIPSNSTILLFKRPNIYTYRTSLLYKYLVSLYPNDFLLNINCNIPRSGMKNFIFPSNAPLSLTLKFISNILELNNETYFLYNSKKIDINDSTKIKNFFNYNNPVLTIVQFNYLKTAEMFGGKEIKVTMFLKKEETFKFKTMHKYMPIYHLYDDFEKGEANKIFINGLLISKDDHRSLASLGINSDFGCVVE